MESHCLYGRVRKKDNGMDNQPGIVREMALFAGAGGGILGGHLLGWKTVCAVEWEPYPASVLVARQNDGILPPFPIWDDVQTFDGKPWRGLVDVVSGGFPCQDISSAGKGAGITGSRSGMWSHMARIIGEVRPQFVFVENSPLLVSRGAGLVIGDLAEMGYDCQWAIISASELGAPHQRDRFWLMAHSAQLQRNGSDNNAGVGMEQGQNAKSGNDSGAQNMADTVCNGLQGSRKEWGTQGSTGLRSGARGNEEQRLQYGSGPGGWWSLEPNVGRVANGVAARVDRLKALGNGQVPIVAATAFNILRDR
jgi:DNA (cytosine-5)-methyltransferase 1